VKKAKKTQAPKQITAFRKAARDLGADESETNFDSTLKKVVRHKPLANPRPKRDGD
jgi:hypothetical protein